MFKKLIFLSFIISLLVPIIGFAATHSQPYTVDGIKYWCEKGSTSDGSNVVCDPCLLPSEKPAKGLKCKDPGDGDECDTYCRTNWDSPVGPVFLLFSLGSLFIKRKKKFD